jgi:hypothetical protein
MLSSLFVYAKYPSVAGIISVIWLGTAVLILNDSSLPALTMIRINIVVSVLIGLIGFRVDRR